MGRIMVYEGVSQISDERQNYTLEDGSEWTEQVLDGLENANWHDAREAFQPLLKILPDIYDALTICGYAGLAQRLEKSTDNWNRHF